jgi:hypothetical protein
MAKSTTKKINLNDSFRLGFVAAFRATASLYQGERLGSVYGRAVSKGDEVPEWATKAFQSAVSERPAGANEQRYAEGVDAGLVAAELGTKRAAKSLESALAGEVVNEAA